MTGIDPVRVRVYVCIIVLLIGRAAGPGVARALNQGHDVNRVTALMWVIAMIGRDIVVVGHHDPLVLVHESVCLARRPVSACQRWIERYIPY